MEQQNDDGRCIIFLDIDGVLNTTKHNTQIHFEPYLIKRLKEIIEKTDAVIVLTTFWRHFHEYITYVLHRHGIDVGRHLLPLPMGSTKGKQSTKTFIKFHKIRQHENGYHSKEEEDQGNNDNNNSMIGRSADDEEEYSSRADEIEAWLKMYGEKYLGSVIVDQDGTSSHNTNGEYAFHCTNWKYVIFDDRPSAAKPNTPLFDRFVYTDTKLGLTEADAEKAIRLLQFGPRDTEMVKR